MLWTRRSRAILLGIFALVAMMLGYGAYRLNRKAAPIKPEK